MTRLTRLFPALLALLSLAPVAAAQPTPPSVPKQEATYTVYSRPSTDKPWFAASYSSGKLAESEVARLKKAGYEVYYRVTSPDVPDPENIPPVKMYCVYARVSAEMPWTATGAFRTTADAETAAAKLKKDGFETFIR